MDALLIKLPIKTDGFDIFFDDIKKSVIFRTQEPTEYSLQKTFESAFPEMELLEDVKLQVSFDASFECDLLKEITSWLIKNEV